MIQSRRVYGDQKEEFELGVRIDCVRSKRRRSITGEARRGEATWSRVQVGGSPESGDGGRRRGERGYGERASDTDAATTLDSSRFLFAGWVFFSWIFVALSTREEKVAGIQPYIGPDSETRRDIWPRSCSGLARLYFCSSSSHGKGKLIEVIFILSAYAGNIKL